MLIFISLSAIIFFSIVSAIIYSFLGEENKKKFLGLLRYLLLPLTALFLYLSYNSSELAFTNLKNIHLLERLPQIEIASVLKGEVNIKGMAAAIDGKRLRSPDSGSQALYYKYTKEKKHKDSEGNVTWSIVNQEVRFVPFILKDPSGSIDLYLNDTVDINVERKHFREQGDYRFSEYRIDDNDVISVFGYANRFNDTYAIRFDNEGFYTPVVSAFGEYSARSGFASSSLMQTWASLALLGASILCVCFFLKIHNVSLFLGLITLSIFLGLLNWSWKSSEVNLESAHERYKNQHKETLAEINSSLEKHNISWDKSWESLGSFSEARYGDLPAEESGRLRKLRLNLATTIERSIRVWNLFPENIIAIMKDIDQPELIPLPEEDQSELQKSQRKYRATSISGWFISSCIFLGLIWGVVFQIFGLRKIKVKKLIENIPTSLSRGITYGKGELKGKVQRYASNERLVSPYFKQECVYYQYRKLERQKSGKNSSWVVVEEKIGNSAFYLKDREGEFLIDPKGAEIISSTYDQKREGSYKFTEYRIDLDSDLYAIGSVRVNPETHDSLYMCSEEKPFILSNLSEEKIMIRKSMQGFLLLYLSLMGFLSCSLSFVGLAGFFNGLSYFLAALVGPLFICTCFFFFIFNDLIYLLKQVEKTWANIEISLQKRSDLIPRLLEIVKAYKSHEAELHEQLLELRSKSSIDKHGMSLQDADSLILLERTVLKNLVGLKERYPDLKASPLFVELNKSLIDLDNEVALMRDGFNNAVERYNTTRSHFPECVVAALFDFHQVDFLKS